MSAGKEGDALEAEVIMVPEGDIQQDGQLPIGKNKVQALQLQGAILQEEAPMTAWVQIQEDKDPPIPIHLV